jgi:hypothetical protein
VQKPLAFQEAHVRLACLSRQPPVGAGGGDGAAHVAQQLAFINATWCFVQKPLPFQEAQVERAFLSRQPVGDGGGDGAAHVAQQFLFM